MKVWERINEIRGENKTVEEIQEMLFENGYCPACIGDCVDDPFENDCVAIKLARNFCTEHKYCDKCIETFSELDYPEEMDK